MSTTNQHVRERQRLDFAKIQGSIQIPNLIEVQMKSYQRFLQMDLLPSERDDGGLQSVFTSVFPIKDFREMSQLEFVDYSIGNWECKCGNLKGLHHLRATCRNCGASVVTNPYQTGDVICHKCGTFNKNTPTFCNKCGDPVAMQLKYDVNECQERGMTYSAPLKVTIRLTIYDKDPDSGAKTIRDIKEQEVFYGDIPLMTENGTFIINGTERVIVSQLHRSPGVFFESANNRSYFLGKIIPYRGSWVEFEYDTKNILYVRIDRKRKFLGSIFLRALGMKSNEDILRTFYQVERISLRDKDLYWNISPGIVDRKLTHEIKNPKTDEVIIGAHKRITENLFKELIKAKISQVRSTLADLEGAYSVADVVNRQTGEVLLEANKPLTAELWQAFGESGITEVDVFFPERDDIGLVLSRTLDKDGIRSSKEALIEIYRKLRPGDPPTLETATNLFRGMFFDPRKYDFSRVGRLKFNIKMGLDTPLDNRTLDTPDFVSAIKYLFKLRKNIGVVDDIDHLGNRRVRAVGELLENQFRIGLVRMERAIKEKMSVYQEMSTAMPHDLVNAKPVMAAIREFFGSSQLSQFMDQTNPLSEITHKRRLSALGPGGLSRERAGFEVRDVHPTHYGRICPIETPEGPNIGLISSLSCFARINDYGFIESPYRKVKGGRIIDYVHIVNAGDSEFKAGEIVEKDRVEELNEELKRRKVTVEPYCFYLSAWEEDKYVVAQANVSLDDKLKITTELVNCRQAGNFVLKSRDEVDYVDVSPKQLVSVAASLIPFLENDDANRALMGSNMQRQAVPLIRGDAPLVGTGMERVTARDSGAVVICSRDGIVDQVDSERIIVRVESDHSGRAQPRSGRGHLSAHQVQALQPEHLHQPEAAGSRRRPRQEGPSPRGRPLHGARRTRPRPQRARRVRSLARVQLRRRHPGQRKAGQRRLLHLDSHRGVRNRSARHQTWPRGNHSRHPQHQRELPSQPGRKRRDPHRRRDQTGRHPRRQSHAQGRNHADAGRKTAARDLRRKSRRRSRRFALLPAGHRRHHRRRQNLLPQGRRKRRTPQGHRSHAGFQAGEEPRRRNPHPHG